MRKILMAAILTAGVQGAYAADMPNYPLRGGYNEGFSRGPLWEGFYVGGQAAQAWGNINPPAAFNADLIASYQQTTNVFGYPYPGLANGSGDKAGYGGFVGYNSQYEDVVVGVEASYLHSSLAVNSNNVTNAYVAGVLASTTQSNLSVKVNDFGSLRLRGGYMMGNFLPYAFVGASAASVDVTRSVGVTYAANILTPLPPFTTASRPDRVVYGYSAGVGIDVMLVGGLFARAEYEYTRFTANVDTQVNSVRVGLGYKF